MLKKGKYILYMVMVACILYIGLLPGISAATSEVSNLKPYSPVLLNDYVRVTGNGDIELWYRADIGAYRLKSAASGETLWDSVITNDLYDLTEYSGRWLDYMQSVLCINYSVNRDTSGNVMKACSASEDTRIKAYMMDAGLRQEIEFSSLGITVILDTTLNSDGLTVTVPEDGIIEKDRYCVISLEIMPFFGAARTDEDGYMVYPDGNGAITYFNSYGKRNVNASPLVLDIYGCNNMEKIFEEDSVALTSIPLIGIKKGSRAFAAAIISGDADASISVNPKLETSPVDLNYEHFVFYCRETYKIYLSGLGAKTANLSSGTKIGDRITGKRSVRFFLLEGDEANYTGMARVYQRFLIDNNLLNTVEDVSQPRVSLTLFMGASDTSSLLNSTVSVTKFSDVADIIDGYLKAGIEKIDIKLRGWNKGGFGSGMLTFKPDPALGGSSGLKKLNEYLRGCEGVNLSLELDHIAIHDETPSFSLKRSVVLLGNNTILTNENRDEYLLSPIKAFNLYEKAAKFISKYDRIGIAVRGAGTILYGDYRRSHRQTRQQTLDKFAAMSSGVVQGVNLYMLGSARAVYDIPFETKMHRISDEQIPWISMIITGCVPSTADVGNTSYDLSLLKLRWIEYGLTPHFELTALSPAVLGKTGYTKLFSSENTKWMSTVLATYNEWKETLSGVYGQAVRKHERVADDIVYIEYENGVKIILNYGEAEAVYQDVRIPAKGYIVMGMEE